MELRGLTLAKAVARAKREIREDMASGRVPTTVGTFSRLHDYVDANGYGGAFEHWQEGDAELDESVEFWNEVQVAVDNWLKDRQQKGKT